jgi:hypothetical protein
MSSPLCAPPTTPHSAPLAVPDPVTTQPTRPKAMLQTLTLTLTTHSPQTKHVLATGEPLQRHPSQDLTAVPH